MKLDRFKAVAAQNKIEPAIVEKLIAALDQKKHNRVYFLRTVAGYLLKAQYTECKHGLRGDRDLPKFKTADVAKDLDVTPTTINRFINDLKFAGLVMTYGREICIISAKKLQAIANGEETIEYEEVENEEEIEVEAEDEVEEVEEVKQPVKAEPPKPPLKMRKFKN